MRQSPAVEVGPEMWAKPRSISMADYETFWKPRGWNLIIIGPTATWRQDWGEWEAIRDIVQNALDEAESYQYGYDEYGFWIADKGKGVAVADFLLGPPKLKPDWARGKFGEGMKIAALALLRKGYPVHIETVGRELWLIFLEQKVNGKAETLAALWQPNGSRVGTTFHIIGYDGPSYDRYFAVNLPRSLILAKIASPIDEPKLRVNQLIRAEGMASSPAGGVIYARDIYLRDIKSSFSYNLWGFDMAPDRHGPKNENELWADVGRLWSGIDNEFLLEGFLQMVLEPPVVETGESRQISMDRYAMGSEPVTNKLYTQFIKDNAVVWQRAWRKVAGANAVIRTTSRWDGWVKHLDYTSVAVQWGVKDALSEVIKTDAVLVRESQERLEGSKVVPDDKLTPQALAHLNLARKIASHYNVDRVYGSVIPPVSDRARTAGYYDYPTGSIFINLDQLENAQKTLDTLIHELGHHQAYKWAGDITKAEDLTPLHSDKMTEVAAYVVSATAAGTFDEEFKGVVW